MEKYQKENGSEKQNRLSEEIAALRKEDKRIHAMLRKYEKSKIMWKF